jgi:hypothetical protein
MNKVNKKYFFSNFVSYNDQGQIITSQKFLLKGTKRYYEYKNFVYDNPVEIKSKVNEETNSTDLVTSTTGII